MFRFQGESHVDCRSAGDLKALPNSSCIKDEAHEQQIPVAVIAGIYTFQVRVCHFRSMSSAGGCVEVAVEIAGWAEVPSWPGHHLGLGPSWAQVSRQPEQVILTRI